MPKLWEIAEDVLALDALLDETNGELTPEIEAAWLAMQTELAHNEAAKLDGYVHYIRSLEMEANAAREEASMYLARAKSREKRTEWIKARLKDYLILTNRKSIKTETGRIVAVQANGGVQALDIAKDLDPATLPSEFVRIVREVNTEAVRKHVEEYGALPFATLRPRGTSLRIR